jgi:hypothetical protein
MKLAAACALLLAAAAHAQTVATVYVSAPQVRITSGETVQLTALARDAAGNPLVNAPNPTWSSNNSAVARVDPTGSVQTAALGIADITATIAGRLGIVRLQVLPARIEVTPEQISVPLGASQQYEAAVYDVNNQPIPGAPVTWRVLIAGGAGDSTTLRISSTGLLSARTLGYYVVRASVLYNAGSNQFEREFAASTSLQVVPDSYTVKPLVSTANTFPAFRLRGKRGNIAANGAGQVAFSATLDGMTGALLTWRGGSGLAALATAGVPGLTASSVLYDFENASIDSRGNVLAQAWTVGTSNNLVLANANGFGVIVPDRVAADAVYDVTNMSVGRFSLSDSGEALFRANFRYPDSSATYSGLLRYRDGLVGLEVSSKDPLPGLTGTVNFEEFGIDSQGVLYFSASAGARRAIYRKDTQGRVSTVIAVNGTLAGKTVAQLGAIAVAQSGDLVIWASQPDGAQLLAWYPPGGSTPAILPVGAYVSAIYAIHPQGGVAFLGDSGMGFGLYRWPAPTAPAGLLLARFGPSPSGEPVAEFYSAAVDAAGSVYATVRGVDTSWMLLRLNSSPAVLASNGAELSTPANLGLHTSLVPGDRTGPVHLLAGGSQQSIFQANDQGLLPALLVGDRLPGGLVYTGNGWPRKSAAGDLYVTADNGLARISPSGSSLVAPFPYVMSDGVIVYWPFNVAVNDAKQALTIGGTSGPFQRLTLFDGRAARVLAAFNGAPPNVTASPGGGVFASLGDMALGESGQAMISASVSGGPGGLFFYDGSAWKAACLLGGSCRFDGEAVTSIGSLRVANNRFCSVFGTNAGNQRLECWEGGAWTNVLKRGDFTSDGTEINFVSGTFDMNRAGDFAVVLNTGLSNQNVFLKTADGYATVLSSVFPLPGGPFVTAIYSVDLRDDRRVYFVSMDNTSRIVVYEATPRF